MNSNPSRVLILGASVRPWIQSCLLAGHIPLAWDLFADSDAHQSIGRCPADGAQLSEFSDFSSMATAELPVADFAILSGGSERSIQLVQRINQQIILAGPATSTLQQFSRQSAILNLVGEGGFPIPEMIFGQANLDSPNWLLKPESGCGGHRIGRWDGISQPAAGHSYLQRKLDGDSMSALYVASATGDCRLIGVTRQLVGLPWTHASEFAYCGSIGPLKVAAGIETELERIGVYLTERLGLRGIWGLDVILVDQRPVVVDVNPRITASAELFESRIAASMPGSILGLHLDACCGRDVLPPTPGTSQPLEAKVILFHPGPETLTISLDIFQRLIDQYDERFFFEHHCGRSLADLPKLKTHVEPGQPLLTLRARTMEQNESELLQSMQDWAAQIEAMCNGQCRVSSRFRVR